MPDKYGTGRIICRIKGDCFVAAALCFMAGGFTIMSLKNINNGRRPEILAPAGSMESLYAAVNAGCDAVYMGGSMFGARAYADNPDSDSLLYAIDYCHLHGVKLYLTVNTLLKEEELMDSLYNYMLPYYKAGLDAAIVQDTGVVYMLHQWFPGLALHASTQMALVTGSGVPMLADYGITRIVPARELSLSELQQMRSDTDAEIEVFVHGALCYCYSGQCLFSSMLGGRSGNRGRCAQPCRLPYSTTFNGKKRESYILSMKELSALPYIDKLIETGADSFKIEGRMKSPSYTALVTSLYRKYTDIYMDYGSKGYTGYIEKHKREFQDDMGQLAEVYNREGFTNGYLEGNIHKGSLLSSKRPKHGGVYTGEVLSTGKGVLKYRLDKDLNAQDVVEFRNARMDTLYEYTISKDLKAGSIVEAKFSRDCIINKGDKAYRTKNAALLDRIKGQYLARNKKVLVTSVFKAISGEQACLSLEKDGIKAEVYGGICQKAEKSATSQDEVEKILRQTGNTEFGFSQLNITMDEGLFLPVSMLKNLRREAITKLRDNITGKSRCGAEDTMPAINLNKHSINFNKHNTGITSRNTMPGTEPVYKASVMTMPQLSEVLKCQKIEEVYINNGLLDNKSTQEALSLVHASGRKCYIVLPHIFRKAAMDYEKKMAAEGKSIYNYGWDGYVIKNLEGYVFIKDLLGKSPENIITDTGLYIMNSAACRFWEDAGVTRHTLPFELEMPYIKDIAGQGMEAVVYTHIPLMVSAQCTLSSLSGCQKETGRARQVLIKDIKGREFIIINYCKYCYSMVYQKLPLLALSCIKDLTRAGIRSFRYDFTIEDAEETRNVLAGSYSGQSYTGHYRTGIL
jgi:Collagenase and related proteases